MGVGVEFVLVPEDLGCLEAVEARLSLTLTPTLALALALTLTRTRTPTRTLIPTLTR